MLNLKKYTLRKNLSAKLKIILVLSVLTLTQFSVIYSQKPNINQRKEQKALNKQRKNRAKEARNGHDEALKHHRDIQGKKTRKRMKKNLRKTNKTKKNKRTIRKNWFKR
jgi:hypothetical protein